MIFSPRHLGQKHAPPVIGITGGRSIHQPSRCFLEQSFSILTALWCELVFIEEKEAIAREAKNALAGVNFDLDATSLHRLLQR